MKKTARGVTLVELLIVVGIIGIAGMISKVGIDIINGFAKQRERIETQKRAQMALHMITKDIRNAKSIVEISMNKLVLQMFNTRLGYDVQANPNLFSDVNPGIITYELQGVAENSFIERTAVYPLAGTSKATLANNILAQSATSIFRPFSFDSSKGTNPPYDGVDVVLPLASKFKGSGTREYKSQVLKRGSLD